MREYDSTNEGWRVRNCTIIVRRTGLLARSSRRGISKLQDLNGDERLDSRRLQTISCLLSVAYGSILDYLVN